MQPTAIEPVEEVASTETAQEAPVAANDVPNSDEIIRGATLTEVVQEAPPIESTQEAVSVEVAAETTQVTQEAIAGVTEDSTTKAIQEQPLTEWCGWLLITPPPCNSSHWNALPLSYWP